MGAQRKFERERMKRRYALFGRAWRAEQRYQESLLAEGKSLPDGTPKLRRKPTFSQWLEITRKARAQKPMPIEIPAGQQPVIDLEWEEEETGAGPGGVAIDAEAEV
jgi:hypothetical protein